MRRRDFLRRTSLAALPGFLAGGAGPVSVLLSTASAAMGGELSRPKDLRILFHWQKYLILHTYLRVLAERQRDPPKVFAAAVETYRQHQYLVPGREIWYTMESYIARADDPAAVRGQLKVFPLEFRTYNLELTGREIAEAILQALPAFEEQNWPEIENRREQQVEPMLASSFEPNRVKLLRFLMTSLNAQPLSLVQLDYHFVDRYLLTGHDTRDINGRYFTIVETQRFSAMELLETVVMVLARIIELEDRASSRGALFMLRERQSSLNLPNPALLPRAVLYWTAGEAVRRVVDPAHQHVGQTRQIYQRAFRIFVPALEEFWNPYLDGGLSLDEAINGMIRRVAEA
jgi:hypothetical protein